MITTYILRSVARLAGADPKQTAVIHHYTKIHTEQVQIAMLHRHNPSLSPQVGRLLGVLLLGIGGVILGAYIAAVPLTIPPSALLRGILSFAGLIALVYAVWLLYTILLSEQDAASLGWWPVRPRSLVLAKVVFTVRELLIGAVIVLGPMTLAWIFRGPVPMLSALGLVISVILTIWLTVMTALVLVSTSQRTLGVRGTRNLMLVFIALGMILYIGLISKESWVKLAAGALIHSPFFPPRWLALLGGAATIPSSADLLWLGGHLLAIVFVTWLAFRSVGPRLMAGFSEPVQSRRRSRGLLARYFFLWGRDREWRIVSRLFIAHVRNDWRFRRHLAVLAGYFVVMIVFAATKHSIGALLVSRDAATGVFSPGMIVFMIAILVPLMIFPMLSASSESKALWIVYAGQVNRLKIALAVRRLFRAVYLYPLLALAAYLYFGTGGATTDSIKQFVLLVLTVELTTSVVHRVYDVFPFAQSAEVVKTHSGLLATGVLAQFAGFIYVLFIFALALQFWPVFVLTAVGLVGLLLDLNRRFRQRIASDYAKLEYLD